MERPRYRVESAAGGWVKNLGSNYDVIVDDDSVGEYQQWDIFRGMPGLYVFGNFATRYYIGRQGEFELVCAPGASITIGQWSLESAGGGYSAIHVPNEDLLWTVINGDHVELRPADGSLEQRFRFISESG